MTHRVSPKTSEKANPRAAVDAERSAAAIALVEHLGRCVVCCAPWPLCQTGLELRRAYTRANGGRA